MYQLHSGRKMSFSNNSNEVSTPQYEEQDYHSLLVIRTQSEERDFDNVHDAAHNLLDIQKTNDIKDATVALMELDDSE